MPTWITTRVGNKIDLDWFKESRDLESAIKDYYKTVSIKPLKLEIKQEAYVKSQIRNSGNRFKGENISLITLPGIPYYIYIFTHSGGKIENDRITIIDAINHDELEIRIDKIRSRWKYGNK